MSEYAKGLGQQALQGLTFGFGDEISGGLLSLLRGTEYEDERDAIRAQIAAFAEANPKAALAAEIAGGLGTGFAGAGRAASSAVIRKLLGGGPLLAPAKAGFVGGAAYGAGDAETLEEVPKSALKQGALGAAFAPAISMPLNALAKRVPRETPATRLQREIPGLPLTTGQLRDSAPIRTMEQTLAYANWGAGKKLRDTFEKQNKMLNSDLFKKAGFTDADVASGKFTTGAFNRAEKSYIKKYNDLFKRFNFVSGLGKALHGSDLENELAPVFQKFQRQNSRIHDDPDVKNFLVGLVERSKGPQTRNDQILNKAFGVENVPSLTTSSFIRLKERSRRAKQEALKRGNNVAADFITNVQSVLDKRFKRLTTQFKADDLYEELKTLRRDYRRFELLKDHYQKDPTTAFEKFDYRGLYNQTKAKGVGSLENVDEEFAKDILDRLIVEQGQKATQTGHVLLSPSPVIWPLIHLGAGIGSGLSTGNVATAGLTSGGIHAMQKVLDHTFAKGKLAKSKTHKPKNPNAFARNRAFGGLLAPSIHSGLNTSYAQDQF